MRPGILCASAAVALTSNSSRPQRQRSRTAQRLVGCAFVLLSVFCLCVEAPAETPAATGSITGVVTLAGEAPKPKPIEVTVDPAVCGVKPQFEEDLVVGPDHGIANAVVSIAQALGGSQLQLHGAPELVTVDQRGCRYEPHVVAFPAGSTVQIINSDGILHSVHTHSKLNRPVNLAQPGFKKVLRLKLDRPELVHITCDQHSWMSGWWFVAANPYYAVTDRAGRFTISGVPAGKYRLEVWQEKLGTLSKMVTIEAGRATTVNFVMRLTDTGS
jgi:plastocyanin